MGVSLRPLLAAMVGVESQVRADARPLRIAYAHDSSQHAAAAKAGRNHWDVYLREIVDELGLRAEEVEPAVLRDAERLARYATLLVGGLAAEDLSREARGNLDRWIRGGGTLVAFATAGIDDLCGNRCVGDVRQTGDDFTCSAALALTPHPLTQGIHSPLKPDQHLLIFSDARQLRPERSFELARLHDTRGADTGCAAITGRQLGEGRTFYFAFSLPQTLWVLHQGRPVQRDEDGDTRLRRSDAIVIRPHAIEVAYADELLFLLQNLIGSQPHPFLHQLPPVLPSPAKAGEEGSPWIPDAVFFWGGDDEASTQGIQLTASNWMREHGLPYHINAMATKDGKFGLSVEDAEKIRANGHEIAPHFNFAEGFAAGAGFTREDVIAQAAAFRRHFGAGWTCSVNHACRWTGWAEPARWLQEAGGKADNSFVHAPSPPSNPVNQLGFGFGTAFPFWFYDDWRNGNRKIDFLEEPITAYECGYFQEQTDFSVLHRAIDLAARYHLTMNLFYHPVYISNYPACRLAIEEALRYIQAQNIRALHLGNDQLYAWWKARSDSRLSAVAVGDQTLEFEVESDSAAGVVVKLALGRLAAKSVALDGVRPTVPSRRRTAFRTELGLRDCAPRKNPSDAPAWGALIARRNRRRREPYAFTRFWPSGGRTKRNIEYPTANIQC